MEFVGQLLEEVTQCLKRRGVRYTVRYTRPARDFFPTTDAFYIIRQTAAEDHLELVAAAKMGKEVENDGI